MLSLNHLSINTISPNDLKKFLIEIQAKLPNNHELPKNPQYLAKYDLESEFLMVSESRQSYAFLSENDFHMCNCVN